MKRELSPEAQAFMAMVERYIGAIRMPEDERDPEAPDEDDDTVGADWDEMGYWDLDGDEWDEEDEC